MCSQEGHSSSLRDGDSHEILSALTARWVTVAYPTQKWPKPFIGSSIHHCGWHYTSKSVDLTFWGHSHLQQTSRKWGWVAVLDSREVRLKYHHELHEAGKHPVPLACCGWTFSRVKCYSRDAASNSRTPRWEALRWMLRSMGLEIFLNLSLPLSSFSL